MIIGLLAAIMKIVLLLQIVLASLSHGQSSTGRTPTTLSHKLECFSRPTKTSQRPHDWDADDAVFAFWIGINDIGNSYQSADPLELTPKLMAHYTSLVEELYADGERKFLFLNVPPTTRSPLIQSQGQSAIVKHEKFVSIFNDALEVMALSFNLAHAEVLDNPKRYGLPEASCINYDGVSCIWWNDYHPSSKYQKLQSDDMKPHLRLLWAW
ncbi:hypothetical protein VTN00DRAFT_765 [Thermoascus crustaceus]|uniref:uncharacterized protein n=1 Tax=Thermoascus crustaceus TaxID=5088 RepID=UPI0037428A1C